MIRSNIALREAAPQANDTICHIDSRREVFAMPRDMQEDSRPDNESVSVTPRDLTNDRRADQILDRAERFIEVSERA